MTVEQEDAVLDWLDDYQKAADEAAKSMRG